MIYLKLKEKPKTIKDLLIELFNYNTGGQLKSVETYSDKECTQIECDENKYRSIDSIIEICKTYFPRKSIKDIITEILFTKIENKHGSIYYIYMINCDEIKMPTMCYSKIYADYNPSLFDNNISKEYEKSKFKSWLNVLNKIGYASYKEFKIRYYILNGFKYECK